MMRKFALSAEHLYTQRAEAKNIAEPRVSALDLAEAGNPIDGWRTSASGFPEAALSRA
jgi:hypothetical protein